MLVVGRSTPMLTRVSKTAVTTLVLGGKGRGRGFLALPDVSLPRVAHKGLRRRLDPAGTDVPRYMKIGRSGGWPAMDTLKRFAFDESR